MKKSLIITFLIMLCAIAVTAQHRVMRSGVPKVDVYSDGVKVDGGWIISPTINPDIYETTAETAFLLPM